MIRVFADTFYFVALTNPRDQAHRRALAQTALFQGEMVTTSWVLAEFANHMSDLRNRLVFVAMLADIRANPQMVIHPPDSGLFEDGLHLYATRLDKEWSLTDCISFIVMQRDGLTEALTGDHHFEQAGFTALLK